jgi:hypothetical protein
MKMISKQKIENRKKYFLLRNNIDFIKLSNRMFDQQMWCWGCDIRNSNGNKMIEFGFRKEKTGTDKNSQSQYSIIYKEHKIFLWGFGCLIRQSSNNSLFMRRYDLYPKRLEYVPENLLANNPKVIKKFFIKDNSLLYKCDYSLLEVFYDLIIDYENWIIKQMGSEYREYTLNSWIKKKIVDAENLILTWKKLNSFLNNNLIISISLKST